MLYDKHSVQINMVQFQLVFLSDSDSLITSASITIAESQGILSPSVVEHTKYITGLLKQVHYGIEKLKFIDKVGSIYTFVHLVRTGSSVPTSARVAVCFSVGGLKESCISFIYSSQCGILRMIEAVKRAGLCRLHECQGNSPLILTCK